MIRFLTKTVLNVALLTRDKTQSVVADIMLLAWQLGYKDTIFLLISYASCFVLVIEKN